MRDTVRGIGPSAPGRVTYHISIRRDGAKKGTIDRDTHYKTRREAIEHVMLLVDLQAARDITGATVYRQKYESWPVWEYDKDGKVTGTQERVIPTFLDPVVSMTCKQGTVRWRDVSGHKDAAYLKQYERG